MHDVRTGGVRLTTSDEGTPDYEKSSIRSYTILARPPAPSSIKCAETASSKSRSARHFSKVSVMYARTGDGHVLSASDSHLHPSKIRMTSSKSELKIKSPLPL